MDLQALKRRVAGDVVGRPEPSFEALCRELIWNALLPAQRPEVVVRVAGAEDVVEAIRFARSAGLTVSIRGGGHHWAGAALRAGSLLVDLGRMDEIAIDAERRTALVQPAVRNDELGRQLGQHGLAFPSGHCPGVKLSGYLLAGGLGWNPGTWGVACHRLAAVEVVTAAGEQIVASADENDDLYWAARGGGVAFPGVVTRFHLELAKLPRRITRSASFHPLAKTAELASWAAEAASSMDACVELTLVVGAAPPELASACADSNGMCCIVDAIAFADDEAEADRALAFLESCPAAECLFQPPRAQTSFDELWAGISLAFPDAHRYLAEAIWAKNTPAELGAHMSRAYATTPSPRSLGLMGFGAPALPAGDTAFAPHSRLLTLCYGVWDDPQQDATNRSWHRAAVESLEPFAAGYYVGEANLAEPGRLEACFGAASWRRLAQVRRRWDPDAIFGSLNDEF